MPNPAELPDLSRVPLPEIIAKLGRRHPVARAAARLRESVADDDGVLSAFSSFIDEEGQRAE